MATLSETSVLRDCRCIAEDLEIGTGCDLGRWVVIESNVRIGRNVTIKDGAFIGEGSRIGDGTVIGEKATLREFTWIGRNVVIEPGVCLGGDGFGFAQRADGTQFKIPQVGIVEIGDDCWVGARATIDRATLGKTLVRDGVRIGPLVMIGHNVEVGENAVLESQCGVSGSTKIAAGVRIGTQSGLVGHLKIGEGCVIESYTGVTKSLAANTHLKGVFPSMPPAAYDEHSDLVMRLGELVDRIEELEKQTAVAVF
jgi:UDP-3-O-[3-hydroxymyristoyl] glucosamine N-acyltransferase